MIRIDLKFGKILHQFLACFLQIFCFSPVFFIGTNCATVRMDPNYSGPLPRDVELSQSYFQPTDWKITSNDRKEDYIRYQIELPKSYHQPPIVMDYFTNQEKKNNAAILISPILGGKNRIATHFARYFSKRGYHCLVVHRPPDLLDDVEDAKQIDQQLRWAVIRDRIAMDWLGQQTDICPQAFGSFGISYGGIKNVVLAGLEKRLKVNIFCLAGGDLATIFLNSNLEELQSIREAYFENNNLTQDQVEKHIRADIQTEPLKFAPYIDANNTLLFLARMDHTVPRANGELLRETLGFPKTIYIPTGHYTGALLTGLIGFPFIETHVLHFFDTHLLPLVVQSSGEN